MTGQPVLAVENLSVEFRGQPDWVRVVDDVSFEIQPGQTVGLVGESGSGKTVTSLAAMGLLPRRAARIAQGSLRLEGRDLRALTTGERRHVRGRDMSMVFQEPMTSLNPAFTIGNQIAESLRVHRGFSRREGLARAVDLLELVGVPDAQRRVKDYPHTFSGGMRQRAMIAMAVACEPRLLIADEPTTALDVTVQAQVLDLLRRLQAEFGMAMLFVTHDLGVVANMCDRVVVLYAGQVVEQATAPEFFGRPRHPYAKGLLDAMPQVGRPGRRLRAIPGDVPRPEAFAFGCRFSPRCPYTELRCTEAPVVLRPPGEARTSEADGSTNDPGHPGEPVVRCVRQDELDLTFSMEGRPPRRGDDGRAEGAVVDATVPEAGGGRAEPSAGPGDLLRVSNLTKYFPAHSNVLRRVVGQVKAVDGVDLTIAPGETLGLVGESGSGKSTVARLILRLIEPSSGSIVLSGEELTSLRPAELRRARRTVQMVFQDPYSSLNPRATVGDIVAEPLIVHQSLPGVERRVRVRELFTQVGLDPEMTRRYPHEFSGGQRQRIAIARALALHPSLVVCDEPISSLDVSTQSQVINLLADLQHALGLAYLFVSHDLSVVRHISHRIAVMYLGQIVELGPAREVYDRPTHPYTEALLSAIPQPVPDADRLATRIVLGGDLPSPLDPPSGCRFHTRCPYAMAVCTEDEPAPFTTSAGTTVRCHLHRHGPQLGGETVRLAHRWNADRVPDVPAASPSASPSPSSSA
jgi:peptide/nickel transport system ATP-binding protein